jgi:hypoxanthine phosphoribosyltransferase
METPAFEKRFDADRIAARVEEIARRLDEDFRDDPVVLLSILKGAAFFAADLARRMRSRISIEYISVRRAEGSDEILQIDFVTGFSLGGRPVVLLKDVVNTGVIETYLSDQLRAAGVRTLRIAAIVDKPRERKTDLSVDYPLFTSEGGTFVGYGMEFQGRHGNLPYVAELAAGQ